MDTTTIVTNTLLAILLGALIGLKNEIRTSNGEKNPNVLGGFRSYALLALLGAISGIFFQSGYIIYSALLTGVILLMVLVYYIEGVFIARVYGITDEASAIIAHFIGVLCITQPLPIKFIVALTIIIVYLLTRKTQIRNIGGRFNQKEVMEITLFGIIALVILPFLPNESYSIADISQNYLLSFLDNPSLAALYSVEIINPFRVWFIVVFVSGINLFGYLLSKAIPKDKSLILASVIGGIVSSTSTTSSLAILSKKRENDTNILVASALFSNGTSFIPIAILILPISTLLFQEISFAVLILFIGCILAGYFIYTRNSNFSSATIDMLETDNSMFNLGAAIKFALLLTSIKLISTICLIFIGSSGFVITSILASLVGIDASVINLAEMIEVGNISVQIAFVTFMGINFANLGGKIAYSFIIGSREFATNLGIYLSIIFTIALVLGLLV